MTTSRMTPTQDFPSLARDCLNLMMMQTLVRRVEEAGSGARETRLKEGERVCLGQGLEGHQAEGR